MRSLITYRVECADRETGKPYYLKIEAESEQQAREKAARAGHLAGAVLLFDDDGQSVPDTAGAERRPGIGAPTTAGAALVGPGPTPGTYLAGPALFLSLIGAFLPPLAAAGLILGAVAREKSGGKVGEWAVAVAGIVLLFDAAIATGYVLTNFR